MKSAASCVSDGFKALATWIYFLINGILTIRCLCYKHRIISLNYLSSTSIFKIINSILQLCFCFIEKHSDFLWFFDFYFTFISLTKIQNSHFVYKLLFVQIWTHGSYKLMKTTFKVFSRVFNALCQSWTMLTLCLDWLHATFCRASHTWVYLSLLLCLRQGQRSQGCQHWYQGAWLQKQHLAYI